MYPGITEQESASFLADYPIQVMERLRCEADTAARSAGRNPIFTESEFTANLNRVLTSQKPHSIIRLADGEGNILMMRAPGPHEALLHKVRRMHLTTEWGQSVSELDESRLDCLTESLRQAVLASDVVGIPPVARMGHWRNRFAAKNVSLRGYAGDIATLAFARASLNLFDQTISDCMLHVWILPLLRLICQDRRFLGLITCHDDLEAAFVKRFGIHEIAAYSVPPPLNRKATGLDAQGYMDQFARVLRDLRVPYPGSLFFVGAGFTGKIICARIKELGGIAIDVGSTMDIWAGENTREWHDGDEVKGFSLV